MTHQARRLIGLVAAAALMPALSAASTGIPRLGAQAADPVHGVDSRPDRAAPLTRSTSIRVGAIGGIDGGPVFALRGVAWSQADLRGNDTVELYSGGRPAPLARFPAPADPGRVQALELAGSAQALGVVRSVNNRPPYDGKGAETENPFLVSRTVLGAPAGGVLRPVLSCRGGNVTAVVAGTFVATLGDGCRSTSTAVVFHDVASGHSFPLRDAPAQLAYLRSAGPYVAWIRYFNPAGDPPCADCLLASEVVEYDTTRRTVVQRIPLTPPLASSFLLGSDGTIVVRQSYALTDCGTAYFAAGTPRIQAVAGVPPPGCRDFHPPIFAGDTLVAPDGAMLLTDGLTGPSRTLVLPSYPGPRHIDFDGTTLAYAAPGCDHDAIWIVPLDSLAPDAANPRPPDCTIGLAPGRVPVQPGRRRLALRVDCPNGCRGLLVLFVRHGSGVRVLGSEVVAIAPPGRSVPVSLSLSSGARELAACDRRLAVDYDLESLANANLFGDAAQRAGPGVVLVSLLRRPPVAACTARALARRLPVAPRLPDRPTG
jgi:hypothetical protein